MIPRKLFSIYEVIADFRGFVSVAQFFEVRYVDLVKFEAVGDCGILYYRQ